MATIPDRDDYDSFEEWMTAVSEATDMSGETLQAIVDQLGGDGE
jgi:hypothetical protein